MGEKCYVMDKNGGGNNRVPDGNERPSESPFFLIETFYTDFILVTI